MAAIAEMLQGPRSNLILSMKSADGMGELNQRASGRLVLGWEEWVAMPDLGVPAIKAKIDTGAKTSALHAEKIEEYTSGAISRVRFTIRPAPRRPDISVVCTAPIIDHRPVTSSNGITENRFVIETTIGIGGQAWQIEVSLSNRRDMTYRMLLGRQALKGGSVLIDPGASFVQPKLRYGLYTGSNSKRTSR